MNIVLSFSSFARKMLFVGLIVSWGVSGYAQNQPPNILFVISDDQFFPHASAYGSDFVETPAFDRVAEEGILFSFWNSLSEWDTGLDTNNLE